MLTHTLFIPRWRPPLANQWKGRHWSVAHSLRTEATDFLTIYARQQRVPGATGVRRVAVEVILGPQMKRSDKDSFDKLLLDSLVEAGLLLDDSERGLAGRMEVSFSRGNKDTWGTRIILEDTNP